MAAHNPEDPAGDRWTARDAQLALGIFVLALLLRLAYLFEIRSIPFMRVPLVDAQSYDAWARRIAAGDWYGDAVFYQAPAYPYFLGSIYSLFGADLWTAHVVQMFVGALSCVLMYLAARTFFDRPSGIASGLLLAFYPPAIFFDSLIQKAGLGLFILCGLLLALARFQARPRAGSALVCGIIVGALALTRENALVFLVAIPIWIALRFAARRPAQRAQWVALFVAGATLVLFPVALRNHSIGGGFEITTSQLGPNFYIGNHPGATGIYTPMIPGQHTPEWEGPGARLLAEKALGRSLTPGEVSSYWLDQGLAFAREQPTEWFALLVHKLMLTLNGFEVPDTEDLYAYSEDSWLLRGLLHVLHFGVILPLAVVGMALAGRRRNDVWLHYWLLAVYTGAVVFFYVMARYRFPLVPLLLPLAGYGLIESARIVAARDWSRLGLPLILAALVGLLANRTILDEAAYRAISYGNLGYIMLTEGNLAEADSYLARAEAVAPDDPKIQFRIAVLRYQERRLDEAATRLQNIIARGSEDYRPRLLLAKIRHEQGRTEEARALRREAARLDPRRGRSSPGTTGRRELTGE